MNTEPTEKTQLVSTTTSESDDAETVDVSPRSLHVHQSEQATGGRTPSAPGQAVSGETTDTVYLSRCVYKNSAARKSLSVHHVQRRLNELGYRDAYTDKDGWYGDLTKKAIAEYQKDYGIDGEGAINISTLQSLFADDQNVEVSGE